ncbi:MAG: ABC transporter substrate-binding protein [Polaromonas sp.]
MTTKVSKFLIAAAFGATAATGFAQPKEITVGYFLEWPLPMMAAKAAGTYDKEMGVKVNWRSFESGTAMSAAMASGDVQIAVSQGVPPLVVAASGGLNIQVVDIAVSNPDSDNCVVSKKLEITKKSAKELAGKTVAVPLGTAAHYGFLRQMAHFGVPVSGLKVINMAPAEGAAALSQGSVDFACGYGGGLARMKEYGNVLLTGKEKDALGILVFDVTSATASFASENQPLLSKFLKVTANANTQWVSKKDPAMLKIMAKEAGLDEAAAAKSIALMVFPSVNEQLSKQWLGGNVQEFMKGVADVFVAAGSLKKALPSYDGVVNTAPLKQISK